MNKVYVSALIDFLVTSGTAFLALPTDVSVKPRSIITIIIGAVVATAKGLKTYSATHPKK